MLLFLDTEFADVGASDLVSIALVSRDRRFEFYAERDPLPLSPTEFVRTVVYPLLNRGEFALPDRELTDQLHKFLERIKVVSGDRRVTVAYDFRGDIHLLDYALSGFKPPDPATPPLFEVFDLNRLGAEHADAVEEIFRGSPQLAASRHHALIDARVNGDAYSAVLKRGRL